MNNTTPTNSATFTRFTADTSIENIPDNVLQSMVQAGGRAALFQSMKACSHITGGYVQLLPEMNYLPALIVNNSKPIFLYEFIELLDEIVDYDQIKAEYPTLSYAQIGGAISFLRKIAQINAKDIDIDEFEDEELIDELREALQSKENVSVFPVV